MAAGGGGLPGHPFGFPGWPGTQYGSWAGIGVPFPLFRLKAVLLVGVAPVTTGTLSICSKVDQIHCGLLGVFATMCRPTSPIVLCVHEFETLSNTQAFLV